MLALTEQSIEETINKAVASAIERELGQYKVPKEQHYQDHIFLTDLRKWMENIRSSFWKSLVSTLVPAILLILLLGFVVWVSFKTAVLGAK